MDCGLCVVNGKIILVGGIDGRTGPLLDSVVEWDPDTGKWSNLNNLRIPRWLPRICVNGGNIYIAGGISLHDDDGQVVHFDSWNLWNLQESPSELRLWARTNSNQLRVYSIVSGIK